MDQFAHDDDLIELADGSGYWSTMAVYHGLHCVKRLHHYIHKDYYYAGLNGSDSFRLLKHTGELCCFGKKDGWETDLSRTLPRLAPAVRAVQRRHDVDSLALDAVSAFVFCDPFCGRN